MTIPFIDLGRQHQSEIKNKIMIEIEQIILNSSFILGASVKKFENDFSEFCGAKYGIAVNSGTAALHLALTALGIGPGDEVITVPNTFIATAEAISMTGASPVFIDIDENTYNIDITRVKDAITHKTKAIIPVHLFGCPADMEPLRSIADTYNLKIIEDACQAHGAHYKEQKIGSIGDAACFSFYPSKNLGALGEGGIITTNNATLARQISMLRNHGQSAKNHHTVKGFNCRMDGIQGAALCVKLAYLDQWIEMRRSKAGLYNLNLKSLPVVLPHEPTGSKHVYHLYVIRTDNRDGLLTHLFKKQICAGVHYPIPIHLQPAYKELEHKKGAFPKAEKAAQQIISLPMFPEISQEQIQEVTHEIKAFLS
jgi:dTDP-4-amino-4,6-dideoxygalactose transaminase